MVDLPDMVDAGVPRRARRQGGRNGEGLAAFTDVEPAAPDRCAAPGSSAGAAPARADAPLGAAEAASSPGQKPAAPATTTGLAGGSRGGIRTTSMPAARRR